MSWTATGITVSQAGQPATQIGNGPILTTGDPIAPLAFTATGPGGGVLPGGDTTMTVTVANPGPSDAIGSAVTVTAPELLSFGTPTGTTAQACTRNSARLLTCTVGLAVGATPLNWVIPLTVSGAATDGQYVDGPCVVDGDARTCTDPIFVSQFANPLPGTVTFGFDAATIRPGQSGTGTITLTSADQLDGLTLSIPLADLPAVFTIADPPDGCTMSAEAITCAGLTVLENVPRPIPIALSVSPSAGAGVNWTPSEVRLFRSGDATDYVTGSGMIASTSDPAYTVTVQIGTPSVPSPAAGQTTVLPITLTNEGPSDASPYVMYVVIPTGTSAGTLPDGCALTGGRTVRCDVATIAAGASVDLAIPLRVDTGLATGTVLGGGCVDNATGQGTVDGACESNDDTLVPDLTVAAPSVDLTISILDPAPKATSGGTVRLALPYSNVGNTSASGVRFLIDPPAGVTVVKAEIVPDAGGMSLAAIRAAADAQDTVTASCVSDPDGDANAVVCTGPDAPIGASSLLYLTLAVATGAPAGTRPVSVTISTTSPEGVTVNNTVTADLTIAAAPATVSPTAAPTATATAAPGSGADHGGGGDHGGSGWLPKTGQNIMGLVLLSFLLVLAGVAARVAARKQPPLSRVSSGPPSPPAPTSRPGRPSG